MTTIPAVGTVNDRMADLTQTTAMYGCCAKQFFANEPLIHSKCPRRNLRGLVI